MRSAALSIVAAGLTVACTQPSAPPVPEPAPDWRELADGSEFGTEVGPGQMLHSVRCWPNENRFRCVSVETFEGSSHTIRRFAVANLERFPTAPADGYSCHVSFMAMSSYSEEITAGGQRLASNYVFRPPSRSEPWARDFVVNLLSESGLPDSYFECDVIAETLTDGSAASLGTSLVGEGDFG